MSAPLVVERGPATRLAEYFRVSAGKDGGEPVTVRVGAHGVWACLTCDAVACEHARAAEAWAKAHPMTSLATEGR